VAESSEAHRFEWRLRQLTRAEKLALVDGRVPLPIRPGLGLVWDADAVKRYTVG
jgi:L-alanine-DL-glutamate epimerase-like enolase superfamily enzyme